MSDGPGVRLSIRERLVLKHIETELRRDRGPGRARTRGRDPWLPLAVALFAAASVFLAVVGMRTSDTAALWAFAVLWPVTLLQLFRLLCRWSRPRTDS
ncbi:DUF3040 domain-containing protein [Streptomyces sp. S.PB5]|uniref:DUF3040 domain-containing protein n=1 Tax=Streptomyces sp. S.PB5 TaxID=3020844 RepID=UPI0025B0FA36|nr:DUF3040 domain-containing protein [Streptomyces sp. S.PB5]MDN3026944.1 DUF3040 domain-containing protein [Streptomyces sp. S.PB5]